MSASSENIFDNLPALEPEATVPQDELDMFLSMQWELDVKDGLRWWHECKHLYPHLYRWHWIIYQYPVIFFSFFICNELATDTYIILQPHQLMLNKHSARAGSCSHTYVVIYQFNQHEPFFASEYGV